MNAPHRCVPPQCRRRRRRADRQLRAARGRSRSASAPAHRRRAARQPRARADARRLDPHRCRRRITVFTGKAELGQGIKTALLQVAAEELERRIRATSRSSPPTPRSTPNEGYTAGSQSMQDSGTAIRHAAAQVRELLIDAGGDASSALPPDQLTAEDGAVVANDGRRLRYGELVAGDVLHVEAQPQSKLKDPTQLHGRSGKPVPRVDIPAKVTGGAAYVQDLRLPGMVHARVVRPPSYGARARVARHRRDVEKMPGVLKVVRDGSFLAVVAEREYQAVVAMRALGRGARWDETRRCRDRPTIYDVACASAAGPGHGHRRQAGDARSPAGTARSRPVYRRPYQMHGSIGPSCAVAHSRTTAAHRLDAHAGRVSAAQGARRAAADAAETGALHPRRRLGLLRPQRRRRRGGRRRAARARAARAAGARAVDARAGARVGAVRPGDGDAGAARPLDATRHASSTGTTRSGATRIRRGPAPPATCSPAWHLAEAVHAAAAAADPQPDGGGDRNAIPLYTFAKRACVHHFLPEMPLRVSALRALGAYMNVFSIESFMDELARCGRCRSGRVPPPASRRSARAAT